MTEQIENPTAEQIANTVAPEVEVKDVREIQEKKRTKSGKVEKDTFLKEDMTFESEFPTMYSGITYEKEKVHSFDVIQKNSFLQIHKQKAVMKSLRKQFPTECRDFIWSGFDGTIQEYIFSLNKTGKDALESVEDVFVKAHTKDMLGSIPYVIKSMGAR